MKSLSDGRVEHLGIPLAYDFVRGSGPAVIFLGGYASARKSVKGAALLGWAEREGRNFIRFDYSGHGESGGRFEDATLGLWRDEALTIIDRIAPPGPVILVGSSMGGWLALLVAIARKERISGIATVACGADFTEEILRPFFSPFAQKELAEKGVVYRPGANGLPPTALTARFMEEAKTHLLLHAQIPIECPARLFHGEKDVDVPWTISQRVLEKLKSKDATLTLVKGGDHRLSSRVDIARLTGAIDELCGLAERC